MVLWTYNDCLMPLCVDLTVSVISCKMSVPKVLKNHIQRIRESIFVGILKRCRFSIHSVVALALKLKCTYILLQYWIVFENKYNEHVITAA